MVTEENSGFNILTYVLSSLGSVEYLSTEWDFTNEFVTSKYNFTRYKDIKIKLN